MSEILKVQGLSAGYGRRPVVRDLSFSLSDGDVLALLGPNGAGKTTVLKAILGMLPVLAGSVSLFAGQRLQRRERERLIAYIPQRMEFDRTFPISLKEMLALCPQGEKPSKYIDMLELGGLLSKPVGELSGGELQRAFLAYAIVREPRLLVMDEPTSWVDAKGADCVLCIIEELREKGIAMIIVSHDFSAVEAVATHVLGLGPEGCFFGPSGDEETRRRVEGIFSTLHHGECKPH